MTIKKRNTTIRTMHSPLGRREFITISSLGLAGVFAGCRSPGQEAVQESSQPGVSQRPNIVLIVADDTGWRDVGYNGSEIRTPTLDRMAAGGMVLDHFYACPTCSPTRAAVLMGRPPSRYGILGPIAMRSKLALPTGRPTLASILSGAGYDTALIGKWHLGLRPETGPRQYGFASSYGYLHGQIDQFSHEYKNGDRSWHRNGQFIDETGHATDLIADETVRRIESAGRAGQEKPFFLHVDFSVPHYPLQEQDQWVEPYEKIIKNGSRRLFAASMTHMDDSIGRILAALEEKNLTSNTLVFFISDNGGQQDWTGGPELYEGRHGPYDRLGDNRPLRDWKGSLYEGGIRVPALIYWPGKISPGSRLSAPVHAMDILPTLCGLAGAAVPEQTEVEGLDFLPAASGAAEPAGERIFYWRTGNQLALRKGDWKLIHQGGSLDSGTYELYNLARDPYEKNDMAEQKPDISAALSKLMEKHRALDRITG